MSHVIRSAAWLITGVSSVLAAESAPPPAPAGEPGWEAIKGFADSSVWQPMWGSGSAPASVLRLGDRSVLRFPCNFSGTTFERASWDRSITMNLTPASGVQFRFFCPDVAPVSQFAIYLHSGDGWYGSEFNPDATAVWQTVIIQKDRTWVEGKPAGWGQISAIRISAWRGANVDTVFYMTDFGMAGADAPVVVIRADATARAAGRPRAGNPIQSTCRLLDALDLPYLLIDDAALVSEHLRGRSLVILADISEIPTGAATHLRAFAEAGGAILSLGGVPEALRTLRGVQTVEKVPNSGALVTALVQLAPKLADRAARRSVERIGVFGPFTSFAQAEQALARDNDRAEVVAGLERVRTIRRQAAELCSQQQFGEAVEAAGQARVLMIEAYCVAQKAPEGEHRAFWCHSAFGVEGMEWDEAIRILAENGFTAILPNMLWGGVAYYDSSVLPIAPEVASRGDQITACLAACRKYGVECHVWKVNWNMSHRTPKAFLDRMKGEGRTQVRFSGEPQDQWLCPSHPSNQQLEIDAMVEVATKYDVEGVHFDYIRYPDADGCFCGGCRERFENAIGAKVAAWPADVRKDSALLKKWQEFRRGNITKVVATVSEVVHRTRPGVKVSAAVFRHWPADRDAIGQDWKLWCDRGYLDSICPMDYTPSHGKFESVIRSQLEWTGKVPTYPGIGLSVWPDRTDICGLIEQIQITRRLKTGGFTVFNYGDVEARKVVPLCGKGITRKLATKPVP